MIRTALRLGLCGAMLGGVVACEEIDKRYARRHLTIPEPVGSTSAVTAPVIISKPIGGDVLDPGRSRDALTQAEYYAGSGYVAARPRLTGTPPRAGDEELVSLNFVETPMLEVVDIVLGRTLGLNYVLDERVTGSVTARTSSPIPESAVIAMLENILALNGAALVESQGIFNIVPVTAVASMPKVVVTPTNQAQLPGTGIHIIPLRRASVASVQEVVATQVSPGNQLAVDHARNILIYTGPSYEARAISEMVSVLDVDILAGQSFALFPVESSNAVDVADELEAIFASSAVTGLTDTVSFLPIERLNGILAISSRPGNLRHVGQWVRRLDRSDAGAGQRIFVYYAKNSRATELAEILSQVFGAVPAARTAATDQPVAPGLQPVELIAPGLPSEAEPVEGRTEEVVPVVDLTTEAETISYRTRPPAASARSTSPDIRFVADERKNALVVVATPQQYTMIEAALTRIDVLPLQVLIEATIAEVTLTDALEYGLQWAFESGDLSASLTDNIRGSVGPSFPGFNLILDAAGARVVLRALSEITDVEVVSSPQLMVLDNQPARLQVGDQVPVLTQSATSVINPEAVTNAIEYFDTGVILEVTPRVNESGLVTLDIVQEVSDAVETRSSALDSPTIQQRRISSTVAVQSGETIALGGLIRERSSEGESGIPLLRDVPVVGNLFKSTGRDSIRTELLVLITPRVVRGPAEARQVTAELRNRLTTLRNVVGGQ